MPPNNASTRGDVNSLLLLEPVDPITTKVGWGSAHIARPRLSPRPESVYHIGRRGEETHDLLQRGRPHCFPAYVLTFDTRMDQLGAKTLPRAIRGSNIPASMNVSLRGRVLVLCHIKGQPTVSPVLACLSTSRAYRRITRSRWMLRDGFPSR